MSIRYTRGRRFARRNSGRDISGKNHTHFCGAYWFYGFHEDGVRSGMRVAEALGSDCRMIPEAGLYTGTLRHRRFRPRAHAFTYKLFMAWLDIDRIPELMAKSPWTSYNRFNWASFEERDHFGDPSALRCASAWRRMPARTESPLPDGPIFLLTHLRYLGYCFNPISFYFCYDRMGGVDTVLAEVNSTFGESRNYWLSSHNRQASANALHYRCPKTMHVSPFMDMNLDYEFVLTEPGDKLVAHMSTIESGRQSTIVRCDARART